MKYCEQDGKASPRVIQYECEWQRAWAVTYGRHHIDLSSEFSSQAEMAIG